MIEVGLVELCSLQHCQLRLPPQLQHTHGAPAKLPQFCLPTTDHNVPLQLHGLCTYIT